MNIRIPGYEVIRELGEGGMCVVYLARHEAFEELVAVKVLHEQYSRQEEMRARFLSEARIMRGLKHENIVDERDFLTFDDRVALVMDYIEGKTLNHVIGRVTGPIPYERAFPLFRQILAAVSHAHSKGIVHRDLKPSNVMVDQSGHVWVMDFGIAKVMGSGGLTRTGTKLGTLYYMSPEQIRGTKDVDHRSDIYSLGMTLYEMLAGRLPFDADGDTSEFAIMDAIVREDLPDPRSFYPHIPEWLIRVVRKAMSKNPENRFQSCEEFLHALEGRGSAGPPLQTRHRAGHTNGVENTESPQMKKAAKAAHRTTQRAENKAPAQPKNKAAKAAHKTTERAENKASAQPKKKAEATGETGQNEPTASCPMRFLCDNGRIQDLFTDLEWRVGPDEDMTWHDAFLWVAGLGEGWRMPTRNELWELYHAGIRYRAWEPFENSGVFVWCGEERDSNSSWGFDFGSGDENWAPRSFDAYRRIFAVRSR